tara:strand:+ start:229 stop:909 length:681 start_codon:yes stop_codon:yes gene_type:complete
MGKLLKFTFNFYFLDLILQFNNILVLAPHCDDGEFGAGGSINKLTKNNKKVTYIAFSTAIESVPEGFPKNILEKEVVEATGEIGIKKENLIVHNYRVRHLTESRQEILEDLIKIKDKNKFDLVLMPSLSDIHQDHITIANEGLRAFKNISIFSYELLWNNHGFNSTCFSSLDYDDVANKILSISKYKSQNNKDYSNPDFIKAHALTRGIQSNTKYAEAFEVVRLFI